MILYELKCETGHSFEAWFKDGATYDRQAAANKVACPHCGSRKVDKAPMAPRVMKKSRGESKVRSQVSADDAPSPKDVAEAMRQLRALRKAVEDNCDYVGPRFPEEARKIHYGETEARNIYGEATAEEAKDLQEEGVEVAAVPWVPPQDS